MSANILLIDDEQKFVEMLTWWLTQRGYTVHPFTSGREALAHVEAGAKIDVAVLDVRMAGIDGVEVLSRIKRNHPGIEVIMVSACGTTLCTVECRRWGARAFLDKPVDLNELRQAIDEAVNARRTRLRKTAARSCPAHP